MTQLNATCIIPFYNEKLNITQVLQELTQLSFLKQIICVDDGSTDGTAAEVKQQFPQVELIRLAQNGGKAAAVKAGLDQCRSDNILLFDADIRNMSHSEVATSFQLFTTRAMDMLILGRTCPHPILRVIRGDVIVSGERWLKKRDLENIFSTLHFEKFALEVAVNHYMIHHQKNSYWFQTSAENTFKTVKYGFVEGWKSTISEVISILTSQFSILNQLVLFRPKKITA